MHIIVCLLLVIAAASGARSGPYLPSGWKPQGPAFFLPGEQKPQPNPEKVDIEPEASDALREYGPPTSQDVSQDLTKQELPDVTTDTTFAIVDFARVSDNEVDVKLTEEENEQQSIVETQTDAEGIDQTNEDSAAIIQVEDVKTESNVESAVEVKEVEAETEKTEAEVKVETEKTEAEVEVVAGVQNIADALANLEKEITVQEFESNQELKTGDGESESLARAPEGFLEYGPPGFKEYGPPKEEITTEKIAPLNLNEVRRRRFSPRLTRTVRRSSQKAH